MSGTYMCRDETWHYSGGGGAAVDITESAGGDLDARVAQEEARAMGAAVVVVVLVLRTTKLAWGLWTPDRV